MEKHCLCEAFVLCLLLTFTEGNSTSARITTTNPPYAIPLPFTSTLVSTASNSKYQTFSVRFSNSFIPFSSTKQRGNLLFSLWSPAATQLPPSGTSSTPIPSSPRLRSSSLTASSTHWAPASSSSLSASAPPAAPPQHAFLLFADATHGEIMKVSPYASASLTTLPLSSIISRPVALGYDMVEDRVYWTDVRRNTISRSFLNGSMFEVLFHQNVQSPDGLAVDFVGRNLYWTDTGTNKLEVSKLDGSYRKALITTGLDEPRDIILDVSKGIMYWTDWGSHAKIEKADMSGQQRIVLADSSLRWPNGLTLDQEKNRLYWVDAYYDKLEYLHLSSKIRVTLIDSSTTLSKPFGLTVLGDYLYWTDWAYRTVYRANKEKAGNVTAFVTGIGQPMDIHGYNLSETTMPENPCLSSGACSHLCLLKPDGYLCSCPDQLSPGDICITSSIPLPFTSTLVSTASNSKYQTFSVKASSSFISFSSTKQTETLFFSSLWSSASTQLPPSGTSSTPIPSSPLLRSSSLTASSTHGASASSSRRFTFSTQIQSSHGLRSSSLTASSTHGAPASSSRRFTFSTQIQSSHGLRSSSLTASSTHGASSSSSRRFTFSTQIQSSPGLRSSSLTAPSTHGSPASSSRRFTFPTQIQSSPRLRSSSLTALSTHVAPTTSSHRFTSASQSETTIVITSEPPTTLASSECRPGDCKNGGTCVVPGYYCRCTKYYVWHGCTIYVGASAVEVQLSLQTQSGPIDSSLKLALAEACTKYFCKNAKCESTSTAGRVKRSERRKYFKSTDIYVLGISLGALNTRKIEVAVLFPPVDGQPPEVAAPDEIVQMVEESKESIGKAVGATVQKAIVVLEVRATEKPTEEPTQPRKEKSKGDQGPSIAPIAGIDATVVALIAVLLACVIYRKRRKRNARIRRTAEEKPLMKYINSWL